MGRPASPRIPRVRRYSRSWCTRVPQPSPTGLSPAAVARSSSLRLTGKRQATVLPNRPTKSSNPGRASAAACATRPVWALPVSLAATPGLLSSPRGTQMFQFPRCPLAPRTCVRVLTSVPVRPGTGCPIRRSLAHPFPARPQSVSPRGRVLRRPLAPRHPPCAHLRHVCADRSRLGRAVLRGARGETTHLGALVATRGHQGVPRLTLSTCRPHPRAGTGPSRRRARWSRGESNPGPPPCKGGALPAELRPQSEGLRTEGQGQQRLWTAVV